MDAAPAAQLRLLDLQALDTTTAQLTHRRRSLPEIALLEEQTAELGARQGDVIRLETEVGDLDRDQRRLESDVDTVRQRSTRDSERLSSGNVGAPKELERLEHEVETLARRQSDLEDQILELMERHEELDKHLTEARSAESDVASRIAEATERRDTAWAEIDQALATENGRRGGLVAELPADLVAQYERIRGTSGGVGAAALRQRRCEGCRLELAGSELGAARTAPPERVIRCENCGRILVRTPESGL